jgi:tRNA threonylcarbamoyladenosine biosynthesis protein TsaB
MLDARRMEVYSAMFTPNLENGSSAEVITEHSFENFDEKLYFVGDCADKCKSTLSKENFIFLEDIKYPSADQMSVLSYEKFKMSDTVDVAYFEPYYLKDFMITTAKK